MTQGCAWLAQPVNVCLALLASVLLLGSKVMAEQPRLTLGLDGYTQSRLSTSSDSTVGSSLNADAGINASAGARWQSGTRQINLGYQFNTRASYGSWLDLDNAESQLSNQLTGSAIYLQQDRFERWDVSASHQATVYNPEQGLTLNPFDLEVRQGLSLAGGVNLQPSSRTTFRVSINAGTSFSADLSPLGRTLGWASSLRRQLRPRSSASVQISQTYAYAPDVDEPMRIDTAQLGLNRTLENGTISATLGISQSTQNNRSNEALTGSLTRRWQWAEHQTDITLSRSISSTLLDLTQASELPGSTIDPTPGDDITTEQGTSPVTPEPLGIQDSLQIAFNTQRLCELCSLTYSAGTTRSDQFSTSSIEYGANASLGLRYQVTPQQTARANYKWQGLGLNTSDRQETHQASLGWSRNLDRRLGVNASLQYVRSISDTSEEETAVRIGANYRLGTL